MHIRFDDVAFHRADSPIFSNVRLELGPGWTGVVGPNGAGKSTFLSLVAGDLAATEGRIHHAPTGLRVAHVPQGLDAPGTVDHAFAEADDRDAQRLRASLRTASNAIVRWPTLSPGERRRTALAAVLWDAPDVLLLDEPEAHLDVEARAALADSLRRFRGVGVLVSHARWLLDALTKRILWVEGGAVRAYDGTYEVARATREADDLARRDQRDELGRRARALASEEADLARRRVSADRGIKNSQRIKGPKDSDGREAGRKGRAEMAASSISRRQGSLGARVARAESARDAVTVDKRLGRDIRFAVTCAPRDRLAVLEGHDLRPASDAAILLERPSLVVRAKARLRLAGPNGAGKSTLLRALFASATGVGAFYLPQHLSPDERSALARELRATPAKDRGAWLSAAGALGTDPAQILASPEPSPGEAKKLLIARALLRGSPVLFLDEPETDLDVPSIERLEAALVAYDGALLLVTHDDELADATIDEAWEIDPQARTIRFETRGSRAAEGRAHRLK